MKQLTLYIAKKNNGAKTLMMEITKLEVWNDIIQSRGEAFKAHPNTVCTIAEFMTAYSENDAKDPGKPYEPIYFPAIDLLFYCLPNKIRVTGQGANHLTEIMSLTE